MRMNKNLLLVYKIIMINELESFCLNCVEGYDEIVNIKDYHKNVFLCI